MRALVAAVMALAVVTSAALDYLSQQFPDADASAHVTTANNAIAVAQKDIITAFIGRSRSAAPK